MAALAIKSGNDLNVALPEIIILRAGASVLIRPATPADSERLLRMFYRLSPTSIYRWCFLPARDHTRWAQTLANVAHIDDQNQGVMVASYAGEIIGIARYDRNSSGQGAEFGIVIEDAWQGCGLGKLLSGKLIAAARYHQIATFTALILGENRPALMLVASLFDKLAIEWHHGECQVSASMDTFKPPIHDTDLFS